MTVEIECSHAVAGMRGRDVEPGHLRLIINNGRSEQSTVVYGEVVSGVLA